MSAGRQIFWNDRHRQRQRCRRLCASNLQEHATERPTLYKVLERLRSGLKRKGRIGEKQETLDARALPNEVGHIDGRLPARRIAERRKAAARCQDFKRGAQVSPPTPSMTMSAP